MKKQRPKEIDGLTFGVVKKEVAYSHVTVKDTYQGQNNCAVIALSLLTEAPYEKVDKFLLARGFKISPEQGTYTHRLTAAYPTCFTEVVGHMGKTVAAFAKGCQEGELYLVRVNRHALAVMNNTLFNTFDGGRRARVKTVYRVVNKEKLKTIFTNN